MACHSIDVASVAEAILSLDAGLLERIAWASGLREDLVVGIVRRACLIHDVGKFAAPFQWKAPDFVPMSLRRSTPPVRTEFDHGTAVMSLHLSGRCSAVSDSFRGRPEIVDLIISAIAGHHGRPPVLEHDRKAIFRFGSEGMQALATFVERIGADEPIDLPDEANWPLFSWMLAGLLVLSDWIGSDRANFPFHVLNEEGDIDTYSALSAERAVAAVKRCGIVAAPASSSPVRLSEILGDRPLRPMQETVENLELPREAAIYVIEDDTGSGKTESAYSLASRLLSSGAGDGVYVALPTEATSNALYDRLGRSYRRLFEAGSYPSIVLAHGDRDGHDGFAKSVMDISQDDGYAQPPDDDEDSSSACSRFLADERKLSLIADMGVGTVDQALLGIVAVRHQSLRLLGLSRKIVVLDEVHGYDGYVQREIESLIRFQAAFGLPVILLSATLPSVMKARLIESYTGVEPERVGVGYPLLTVVRAGCSDVEESAPRRSAVGRTVPVEFESDVEGVVRRLRSELASGRCAIWIRNTVSDVVKAAGMLSDLNPTVFHSRFTFGDRRRIEASVVAEFGPKSTRDGRRSRLVIATQVVEQSLDVDFDFMVSDLAPMDLLIQRAGRLWRHERSWRTGVPTLLVLAPAMGVERSDWFSSFLPGAAMVYRDHGLLWKTADLLLRAGRIESPTSLRPLVDEAYSPDGMPAALAKGSERARSRSLYSRSKASANVLDVRSGYMRQSRVWDSDESVPTREVDRPTCVVRFGEVRDGGMVPLRGCADWRASEIRVPLDLAEGVTLDDAARDLVVAVRKAWPASSGDMPIVPWGSFGDGFEPACGGLDGWRYDRNGFHRDNTC